LQLGETIVDFRKIGSRGLNLPDGLDADGTLATQGTSECFCTNPAKLAAVCCGTQVQIKEALAASLSTKTKNRKPQNKGPNKQTPNTAASNSKVEIILLARDCSASGVVVGTLLGKSNLIETPHSPTSYIISS